VWELGNAFGESSHKWVRQFFIAYARLRAVTGVNDGIVIQAEQTVGYRMDQCVEVSARKVGSSNGLIEQSISSDDMASAC